jgi:DNA-binding NtrC family response regulator
MITPFLNKPQQILFVDDEESLATLGRRMLELQGYRVVTRTSGTSALETFGRTPDAFGLVIADMIMPDLNGLELARSIRRIRPEARIILCTGMGHSFGPEMSLGAGIFRVLMKPIVSDELIDAVKTALRSEP